MTQTKMRYERSSVSSGTSIVGYLLEEFCTMRLLSIDTWQTKLEAEARSANKHPLNLEAQRWREECARMLKEPFYVEPIGNEVLHVDDFLVDATDELEERRMLGSDRADVMREIVWSDLPGSPKERLQWWLGLPGEAPTNLERRLKESKNLQEAMIEVVEALHWNLIADPDLSGVYDPMGTLN